jgi:anti-sigma factor RsiW
MTTRQDNEWYRLVEASVDGELGEPDATALREAMAEREDLSQLEAALREMRELVRTEVEVAADSVDLDSLWARVEAQLP